MAEITKELGRIPVSRGDYQATTEYYKDNIVQYKRSSYQVISESPIVGVPPTNDKNVVNPGWTLFAGTLDAQDVVNQIKEQEAKSIQAVADREAEILAKSDAAEVSFDNTGTSLSGTNVQDALKETDGKISELESEVIYDVTANNDGITFPSLSALLSSENLSTLIPTSVRHGGMSVRFVQSSDNKYVQYLYLSDSTAVADFTNVSNWEKVNLEKEIGSVTSNSNHYERDVQGLLKPNGTIFDYNGYGVTSFIDISSYSHLVINSNGYCETGFLSVAFYSEEQESSFISGKSEYRDNLIVSVPYSAKYARFTMKNSNGIDISLYANEEILYLKEHCVSPASFDFNNSSINAINIGNNKYNVSDFALQRKIGEKITPSASVSSAGWVNIPFGKTYLAGTVLTVKLNPTSVQTGNIEVHYNDTDKYFFIKSGETKNLTLPVDTFKFKAWISILSEAGSLSFDIIEAGSFSQVVKELNNNVDSIKNTIGNKVNSVNTISARAQTTRFPLYHIYKTSTTVLITLDGEGVLDPNKNEAIYWYYDGAIHDYFFIKSGETKEVIVPHDIDTLSLYNNTFVEAGNVTITIVEKDCILNTLDNHDNRITSNTNRIEVLENADTSDKYLSISMFDKIGVCGDSFTRGAYWTGSANDESKKSSWGKVLGRLCGIDVSVFARSGANLTIFQSDVNCLPKILSEPALPLYIFCLGINDTLDTMGTISDIHDEDYTLNANTFYGNYGKIIQQIKNYAPNAMFVLCQTFLPTWNNGNYYNYCKTAIQEIATHYGVPCLDTKDSQYLCSTLYNQDISTGNGHPSLAGYSGIGKAMNDLLSKTMKNNLSYFRNYHPAYD